MKKRTIITTAMALLLSIPLFLAICGFGLPEQYGDTFMGELKYKVQRLDETEGSRIVLIGGSGVAFGIDSSLLAQELPRYSPVNFGMYAALGTKVMLDLAEQSIRKGDIVIISPEQNVETLSGYFNAEILWQGMDGAYDLLGRLKPENAEQMLAGFPGFAGSKLRYALIGKPRTDGIYRRDSFNDYGDISADRPCNVMPGRYDMTMPVSYGGDVISDEFIEILNQFAAKMGKKGAAVYYRFCPVNRLAVDGGSVDDYYDYLESRLAFSIIGDPNNSILNEGWFYDTNFHLNSAGAVVNTRQLVRDLKAVLGDSSPTAIEIPTMPTPANGAAYEGDSTDAELFLYEPFGDGLRIVGLTAEGKEKQRLTVPVEYEGKKVIAISEGAFTGSRAEEAVIQENIAAIADGAFADSALRRILLTSSRPSATQVGQELLAGTNADIYVPEEALSSYRVSYYWSPYAAHIHPTRN